MDDLISRQAAIDALMVAVDDVGVLDAEDIETVFALLPSEQPEIVRCQNCMYGEQDADCGCPLERPGWHRTDDDFCSRAERRTDE